MNYCVYLHINEHSNEVFYVGIGTEKRPFSKRSRSDFWKRVVEKYGYSVKIIHSNLTFEQACELEIKYINEYGRIDIGTGTLVNLTNGGEGSDGYKHTIVSKDKIKKHWANYRGFDIGDIEEYNREYQRKYQRVYREDEKVKEKNRKYSKDKYHNMTPDEKEEHKRKKKEYRDNLSEERKSKNREYQRKYKASMTEEQKEKQRNKNRENMRKKSLEKKKKDV